MNADILITPNPLDLNKCVDYVSVSSCGGINLFVGTVRDMTKGKRVIRLEFEAYENMALTEMRKLAEKAFEKWPVERIAIHHRSGILEVGDLPIIIAVSAAHRDTAFEACRFLIDTLKQTVPIWKKEIFEDGEVWVSATP